METKEIIKVYGCPGREEASIIKIKIKENNEYDINTEVIYKPMTENDMEYEAKKYLEDGETWKMAVEGDHTTLGLDDWVEQVLNIDGAMQILDAQDYNTKVDDEYYFWMWSCCGCIENYVDPLILKLEELNKHTRDHSKPYSYINKYPKIYKDMVAVQTFKKLGESENIEERLNKICEEILEY